jgi:hypothetical protein
MRLCREISGGKKNAIWWEVFLFHYGSFSAVKGKLLEQI